MTGKFNMKESEAKTKWCPLTRAGNESGFNRNGYNGESLTRCIGRRCMMWESWPEKKNSKYLPEAEWSSGDCGLKSKELFIQ